MVDLVVEGLDRIERDGPGALASLCAEHPEHAATLTRRLALLVGAGLIESAHDELGPGARLGEYELAEEIGEGAMGRVYRARHVPTGRAVAVKVVRPELLAFGDARARFRREVELAARLEHPGIVSVLAVGEEQGRPWFASELVRGISLSTFVTRLSEQYARSDEIDARALADVVDADHDGSASGSGHWRRSWRDTALDLGIQLARALAHAHGHGVLHRDVKPSNVLVRRDGTVVLADLGLAAEAGEGSLTRSGSVVGSLPYTAPEILEGRRADVRSDVYSLGATLYELWTLERAFTGRTTAELMRRVGIGERRDPRRLAGWIDADAAAVLERALAVDPDQRYATVDALAWDLEALADGRPTRARPLSYAGLAARAVRRRPAVAVALLLAALLLLVGPLAWGAVQAAERRVADDSARTLDRLNTELSTALASEQHERARADENLIGTADAIDALLANTSDLLLADVPFARELRVELVASALKIVEGLRADEPTSDVLRFFAARVELAATRALLDLGDYAQAIEAAARGLEHLRAMEIHHEFVDELTLGLTRRQAFAVARSDPKAAIEMYLAALELPESTPMSRVDHLEVRFELGVLQGRILSDGRPGATEFDALIAESAALVEGSEGIVREAAEGQYLRLLVQEGTRSLVDSDDERAVQQFDRALGLAEEMLAREPGRVSLQSTIVVIRSNYVTGLLQLGRLDEAEFQLETGLAEVTRLSALFPTSSIYATRHVGLLNNAAYLANMRGDMDGAEAAWLDATVLADSVLERDEVPDDLLLTTGQIWINLASAANGRQDPEAVLGRAERAAQLYARVAERAPHDPLVLRGRQHAHALPVIALLELGRSEEALVAFEQVEELAPQGGDAQRMVVELALNLAAGRDDEDWRDGLHARANAALARAIDGGYDNARDLDQNPRFAPLRARDDWPEREPD